MQIHRTHAIKIATHHQDKWLGAITKSLCYSVCDTQGTTFSPRIIKGNRRKIQRLQDKKGTQGY